MAESLAFREWAKSEGLVTAVPISEFEDAVIGYDAEDFINILLVQEGTKEPLLPALGGLPFALRSHIDRELANIEKFTKKKPLFIFNGIDLELYDRKFVSKESERAVRILEEAWRVYDSGDGDAAVRAFERACTYRTGHILRFLYHYLHEKGANVMVAPYNAAAQLAYTDSIRGVAAAHGSASLLAFGIDKFILHFDWDAQLAHFIDRGQALSRLSMDEGQLTDLLMLSGLLLLPPIPEIIRDNQVPSITAARQVLRQAGMNGFRAAQQSKDKDYETAFKKASFAVRHMIVCERNGDYKQLNFKDSPNDIAQVVGVRYPNEVYHYLAKGVIGPRVLSWRARLEIFESPPLDGGSSAAYRELVQKKLQALHLRSIAIVSSRLTRWYQNNNIDLICWFNENDKQTLDVKDNPSVKTPSKEPESWHVRDNLRRSSPAAERIDLNATPIHYAITWLSDDALAKKSLTKREKDQHSVLTTPAELLSNTTWRFLHDRGYINSSDHTLTAWGKALKAAFEKAAAVKYLGATTPPREAEEAIFTAFELLRLDLLNGKDLFPGVSGGASRGTDQDKANVQLITRVATLGTFKHQSIGYTGPLSRNTLAYHQVAAAVRNSLRDLVEVHAMNLLVGGSAVRVRDNEEYTELGGRLPFLKEPDVGLALVVKSYLDELCQPPERRTDVRKWFIHAEDIDGDIDRAWKLWDAINAGIQAADGAIVGPETRDAFEVADSWLQAKRASGVPNGTNGVE
ncbi:hypothetical protein CERZMDRAFT_93483 [Cercospora zeae-maydis SCOH1-5]|uniref:XPG-I domain-containing protein n=1 Tax=Cercospora zeae-maydis SCOH1-5 TaxID=717836 RepID=A0A6A6FSD1_9PEZI|nr:hypothetical protein CERZMDRAFT_93483 [Cercospora zeae-maydis SCOH1-5]